MKEKEHLPTSKAKASKQENKVTRNQVQINVLKVEQDSKQNCSQ
jgi:hypothetical protein